MNRTKPHKTIGIWLLLVLFALPWVAKTVHTLHLIEHTEHACSGQPHTHHRCNDCPVCQFMLSAFTETPTVEYDFRLTSSGVKPVDTFVGESYRQVLLSYTLRAPPVA